jgi:glycosyltransferase involved in cell wall biosynthesis
MAALLKKLTLALLQGPFALRRTTAPRLAMTLLVKDEVDMIEENLRFHKAMGVDYFIVTDNNSTDGTLELLRRYQAKGWIKEIIEERATNYEQKQWVDRMVWLAKTRYKADWVINADADELWYTPTGNLKATLSATRANVLQCELRNVYPDEAQPFTRWDRVVKAVPEQEAYGLSRYSLFERQNYKVAHRTAGYVQISMGNHKVTMFPRCTQRCDILIYHYTQRGKQQFMRKMINGGKQYEQHKSKHGGRHWRYFYRLYKEGLLEQEYDKVIGRSCYERLCSDGYIFTDRTIPDFFNRLNAST